MSGSSVARSHRSEGGVAGRQAACSWTWLPPTALGYPCPVQTSRRDTSISTAKLVMWLHWQLTWLSLRKTTSQPRADQPPVPLTLREEDGSQGGRRVGSQEPGLLVQSHGGKSGTGSQDRMVPEDADGLGPLLGLQQPELHGDWLVQSPGQEFLIVVDADAHHRGVDDWALGDSDDRKVHGHQSGHRTHLSLGDVSRSLVNNNLPGLVLAAYLRLRLSGS